MKLLIYITTIFLLCSTTTTRLLHKNLLNSQTLSHSYKINLLHVFQKGEITIVKLEGCPEKQTSFPTSTDKIQFVYDYTGKTFLELKEGVYYLNIYGMNFIENDNNYIFRRNSEEIREEYRLFGLKSNDEIKVLNIMEKVMLTVNKVTFYNKFIEVLNNPSLADSKIEKNGFEQFKQVVFNLMLFKYCVKFTGPYETLIEIVTKNTCQTKATKLIEQVKQILSCNATKINARHKEINSVKLEKMFVETVKN